MREVIRLVSCEPHLDVALDPVQRRHRNLGGQPSLAGRSRAMASEMTELREVEQAFKVDVHGCVVNTVSDDARRLLPVG